jgi:hypothetical protein
MTPRRPKALRIGGREWRFRWRRPSAMGDCCGLTHYDKGLLDVAACQTPFDSRDTALHEAMHAILAQQGRTTFGNEEEELYVRALSTGLMGVLQDNPEFARWLIQPLTRNSP